MRYVVLVITALLGALITGGVSPQLPILGTEPDLLLIFMLALTMCECTITPVLVCSVAAIFMDFFYAQAIGYYSFPYLLTGCLVFALVRNMRIPRIGVPSLFCGAAWLIKDLLMALLTFLLGNTFDFWYIFLHSTLTGVFVNALLMLPIYLFFSWLCSYNFMRPHSISIEQEFPNMIYSQKKTCRSDVRWKG